jgi:hypothetical protein
MTVRKDRLLGTLGVGGAGPYAYPTQPASTGTFGREPLRPRWEHIEVEFVTFRVRHAAPLESFKLSGCTWL